MLVILEICLLTFSAWTLVYHISLLGRFPSRPVFIFFIALLVPLFYLYLRHRRNQSRGPQFPGRDGFRFGTGVAALALAGEILALVLSHPDIDDLDFFHRAMVRVGKPNEPFTLRDTIYNLPDLPPISLPHYLSSYEMLVSFAGALTGLGPLQAYHNLAALIVGGLVPLVYVCLYRELGVGRSLSLLAAAAAIAFLLLDGNTHRSFGNYGLIRCWQGKVVLVVLLTPLTLLSALRFLRTPTGWNYLAVTMCAISAAGLSSSGIFMIPILIFGISLAYVAAGHGSSRSLAHSGILNIASIYPVILAGIFLVGIIPLPKDTLIWEKISIWPRDWWSNLQLVIGGKEALIRDILILFLLPIACLPRPKGRLIVALSLIFIIIFANPLLGPHWVSAIKPGGYWRLAFLFPIPLCAGLVVCCLQRTRGAKRTKAFRCLAATVVILAGVWADRSTVFTTRTRFKSPFSYRFYPRELTLVREAAGEGR
ncbi:MAG: DUF6077 domain-containing protein [Candidatus Erginobacter occultus]|nr:DUF6077 domain-containing protein [Candidatus Erginobacter occultus]